MSGSGARSDRVIVGPPATTSPALHLAGRWSGSVLNSIDRAVLGVVRTRHNPGSSLSRTPHALRRHAARMAIGAFYEVNIVLA